MTSSFTLSAARTGQVPGGAVGRLAMAAVCLAFFGTWTFGLARPALTGDEAVIAVLARQSAGEVLARLNADEPHPPVYYLSMLGWSRLIPREHELLLRLPAVFLGVLALSLTFRLGRALGLGTWSALGAAVLLGLNPQLTVHVREARMYGPMVVTVALAALATVRAAQRRGPLWAAALAGLLALFTHYFNSLFIAVLSLWGFWALSGRARRDWVIAQGLIWAALAGWLVLFGRGFFNPTSLSTGKTWSFLLPPWETLARLAAVGSAGYRAYAETALTYLAAPLFILSWLLGCWLSRGRARWLPAVMVAGPLSAYAALAAVRPVFHPKYALPWLLFAALGAGQVLGRRRPLGLLLGLSLAACLALPTWETLRRPYEAALSVAAGDQLTSLPRDLGRGLLVLAGPADVFGLTTPDPAHCYYTERYFDRTLGCALLPAYPGQPVDELARQVDKLLAQHRLLWLLDFYNPAWDPGQVATAALAQRAVDVGQAEIAGRTLTLYAAPGTVLREQEKLGAQVGDFAELEGAWVVPAQSLRVVLAWRSLADRPAVDGKVFVHLMDASGAMLAQADGIPVRWSRPFGTWRLGEQLFDVHVLDLAPEIDLSTAALRVGVYRPDTLKRFSIVQSGERLPDDAVPIPIAPDS